MQATDINEAVQSALNKWQRAGSADVAGFVEDNPSVVGFKSLLLDLIYEEYCQDQATGRPSRIEEHVHAFPNYQESIHRLVEVHSLLAEGDSQPVAKPDFPKKGDVIAGLRIVSSLGQGSFSRVYLAEETALGDRMVVAKFATVLQQEAALLGKTPHPNIIPILRTQQVEESRLQVICMPFLGIVTLVDVLDVVRQRSSFPDNMLVMTQELKKRIASDRSPIHTAIGTRSYVDFVLQIGVQVANALAVMHARSIIHCDIKPSNILLSFDGAAIVLDLNLSRSQESEQTLDGGTLAYMAPERLIRIRERKTGIEAVHSAEDVYSLGIVLYELLSGNRSVAFGSDAVPSLPRLLDERRFDDWHRLPGTSKIKRVIQRCLSRNPDERPTAKVLRRELERALQLDQRILRYSATHRRRVVLVAGVGLLSSAMTAGYLATRPTAVEAAWTDGIAAYRSQQFDRAEMRFSSGIEVGGPTTAFLFVRGQSRMALDKFEYAEEDFRNALAVASQDQRIRILESLSYSQLRQRHYFKAERIYEDLLELDSKNYALLNNLAFCYSQTGLLQSAQDLIDRAVKLAPKDPVIRNTRAYILLGLATSQKSTIALAAYEDVQVAKEEGRIPPFAAMDAAIIVLGHDPTATDEALDYLEEGVDQGLPREVLQNPLHFERLRENPRFKALTSRVSPAKSKGRECELTIPPPHSPLLDK